jgi:hypothetical protein
MVLRLLRAVDEAAQGRRAPHWVSIASLRLRVDRLRLEQAIAFAARSGWLKVAGHPPLTVALTESGTGFIAESDDPAESA